MAAVPIAKRHKARTELVDAFRDLMRSDSTENRRAVSAAIVEFRRTFLNHKGLPDLAGRSKDYKIELEEARETAGASGSATDKLLNSIRWHTADAVRDAIRKFAKGDDAEYRRLCQQYAIKPERATERHAQKTRVQRSLAGGRIHGGTVLALMSAARDQVQREADEMAAGRWRPPHNATPDVLAEMVATADALAELLPRVVDGWRNELAE
ncbi:MAG TPA: hypothetical protein VM677_27945 [Actinokineospora sp.]|nr:hypothetical protein [Actinokineospora sp.]